jgi:hypothetical protein
MHDISHGESDRRVEKRVFELRHREEFQPLVRSDPLTTAKRPLAAFKCRQVKEVQGGKYISTTLRIGPMMPP